MAREVKEWMKFFLERDPDDHELAQMSRDEIWAIWEMRYDAKPEATRYDGPVDELPSRWESLQYSELFRKSYADGNKSALMDMLAECAKTGLRIPQWAAEALVTEVYAVFDYEKGSWDEVFGRPIPKGAHMSALARRRKAHLAMLQKFRWLPEYDTMTDEERNELGWGKIPGVPIDDAFFEDLGKEIGVSRTVAKELYYDHKRRCDEIMKRVRSDCRENDETSGNTDA